MPYKVIDRSAELFDGKRDKREIEQIKGIALHRIDVGSDAKEIRDFFVDGDGGLYTGNQMPYTFVIGEFGIIEQVLDLHEVGPHALRWSVPMVSIAFIGDFRKNSPSKAQFEAGIELCTDLCLYLGKRDIRGHDELPGGSKDPSKQCPGKFFEVRHMREAAFEEADRLDGILRPGIGCISYHMERCGIKL